MGLNALGSFFGGAVQGAFQGMVVGADADRQAQLEAAKAEIETKRQKALMQFGAELQRNTAAEAATAIETGKKDLVDKATASKIKEIYNMTPDEFKEFAKDDPAKWDEVAPSRTDQLRMTADAARSKGFYSQAKEVTGEMDTERRFTADEAKNLRQEAMLKFQAEKEAAKNALEEKKAQQRHEQTLAAIASRENKPGREVGDDGTVYSVNGGKAVPVTKPDGSPLRSSKNTDIAEEKMLADRIKTKEAQIAKIFEPTARKAAQSELAGMKADYQSRTGQSWAGDTPAAANPNRKPLSAFGK